MPLKWSGNRLNSMQVIVSQSVSAFPVREHINWKMCGLLSCCEIYTNESENQVGIVIKFRISLQSHSTIV